MCIFLLFYYFYINKFLLIWQPLILVYTNLDMFYKALLVHGELNFFFMLTTIINYNSKKNQNLECCFTQKFVAEGSAKV